MASTEENSFLVGALSARAQAATGGPKELKNRAKEISLQNLKPEIAAIQ